MRKYYVSHQEQQMGPYGVDEIVHLVHQGTLSPLDYLYDEDQEDWILFIEHGEVAERVKDLKPKSTPKAENSEPAPAKSTAKPGDYMAHEWFILKGDNKFGPFSYPDMIKMLQQGVVFEFDFAWHDGMEQWQRVAELEAFAKEHIASMKKSAMPEISQVFFRRRHKRVQYGGTLLIHDNKKVWKGKAVEISEGGAGVIMENSIVVPGQQLYLHFKPGDGVPPFNAICEVVSKQYVSGVKDPSSPVKYGLKFKTISAEAQKVIDGVTREGKAAA